VREDYGVFGIFFVHWEGVFGFDRAVAGDRLRDISDLPFEGQSIEAPMLGDA